MVEILFCRVFLTRIVAARAVGSVIDSRAFLATYGELAIIDKRLVFIKKE